MLCGRSIWNLSDVLGYATLTRSAIQAQLTYLQSRLANPCLDDWLRALKVLRYLKGTCDYAIRFPGPCSSDATTEEILDRNRLWATVDASYAACVDGRGINAITISLGTYCPGDQLISCLLISLPNLLWVNVFICLIKGIVKGFHGA